MAEEQEFVDAGDPVQTDNGAYPGDPEQDVSQDPDLDLSEGDEVEGEED